jgi:hypothetical protein
MKLNEIIMCKLVAFVLCDNVCCKLLIIAFLYFSIVKSEKQKVKIGAKDLVVGYGIIVLNEILSFNFIAINFLILGIISSIKSKMELNNFINCYFMLIMINGVIVFCLNL